ncbi:hypothetical protein Vafri_14753 [Volvox africanus]|uniref:PX domain-containing protein n=1 Tax=Volvox africanus TaxID=51714 RepID=A0A8J4BG88_9CHLO|nr:hypothetical protein Vafri_14753 [Volvox africanus]
MAWRYACNIPTYITGKDENGEPVVLYRVNIFCRQEFPDGANNGGSNGAPSADSAPFFVLRRYSQFRHLHDQLKAAFPAIMSARGMAPPAKHPLVLGDKRDALERRRVELERWMWRLMATPEMARGSQLKAFLELDKALARAQQQQQRQRVEQQQRLLPDGAPDHVLRGGSVTTPASESGYGSLGGRHHHLAAYPGGGGGASVLGDDSASDASGPSGVGSMAGPPSSVAPGGISGASAGGSGTTHTVPPDPRAIAADRSELETGRQHLPHQLRQPHTHHGALTYGTGSGGAGTAATSAALTTGVAQAARLGIHLQNRADVRRVVDLLVQRLETASSETEAALNEVTMLRDANLAMAARLGELELERAGQGQEEEARSQLAQSEAARATLEQRVAELEETLSKRGAAHAQQISQLQSQLSEARTENAELLRRLQEWDVGSTVTVLAAQQRAEELQQRLGEQQRQVDEQLGCLDAQKRQLDEQRQRTDEQQQRADELQRLLDEQTRTNAHGEQELQGRLQQLGRELEAANSRVQDLQGQLKEQEQQLADLRTRKEQAAAAVTVLPPPPQQHQHQILLDRARADNALLAQEVQRLRNAAAAEREVHKSVLAAHSQTSAQLEARVKELEAQLSAAPAAAAAVYPPPAAADRAQELLLL